MSRLSFLALIGITTLTSTALAAHPTARDNDGDGFYVPTVDVNGDGALTASDIGVAVIDCDDFVATTNPKAPERPYDSVDNDCNSATTDAVTGLTEDQFNKFLSGEYGGIRPTTALVEHEVAQCASDATACTVNMHSGRFEVLTPTVKVFEDIFVNGSVVLRNSGQKPDGRELVTVEQFEHFRGTSTSGTSSSTPAAPVYRGPSKATRLAEATAVATPLVEAEAEARLAADAIHDTRLDGVEGRVSTIEMGNTGRDESINIALAGMASNLEAIEAETEARIAADKTLAANDRHLEGRIDTNTTEIGGLASSGVAVNVGIAGGLNTQRERIVYEETIRGPATGLIGFDAAIHVDLDQAIVGPFATVAWGSDGSGSGADTSALIGFEGLYDVGDSGHHVGGFGAWRSTHSMSNMLDTAVPANGACGGVSYRYQAPSAGSVTVSPWARVGGCYETYADKSARLASDGSTEIVVDGGSGGGITAMGGLSFSITSVRDR